MEDLFSPVGQVTIPSPPTSVVDFDPIDLADRMTATGTPPSPTSSQQGTPTAPTLGGLIEDTPWIGGPPNESFDGPLHPYPLTPLCRRPNDSKTSGVNYSLRTNGLDPPFKRDDPNFPLLAFADEALSHMQEHGMDTVFYMTGGKEAVELFTYHTRYTRSQVEKHINAKIADGTFDRWQVESLRESALWLKASLDPNLRLKLRTKMVNRPSGPVLWMIIVEHLQAEILTTAMNYQNHFNELKLASFKGEDVDAYCDAVEHDLMWLAKVDRLPDMHLLTICDARSKCSVMPFRIYCMNRQAAIHQFVTDSANKDKTVVESLPNYLTFAMLLEEARTQHKSLVSSKKWGSATPSNPEQANLAKIQALINRLDQKITARDKPNGNNGNNQSERPGRNGTFKDGTPKKCRNCGSKDHFVKDCPKPKADANGQQPSPAPAAETPAPNGSPGKWAPPKANEPTSKKIDGTLHHYCKKCRQGKGKWTRDHTEAQHIDGYLKQQKGKAGSDGEAQPAARLASTSLSALNQDIFHAGI